MDKKYQIIFDGFIIWLIYKQQINTSNMETRKNMTADKKILLETIKVPTTM